MQSILAVDDSPSMRKMVSFTLTGAGYHVVEAVDGQDALEGVEPIIAFGFADQNMPRFGWDCGYAQTRTNTPNSKLSRF